jgi:homoserine kinase
MTRKVRVTVPATSANLGPGFDTLGLALRLHDVVEAQIVADGLDVEVSGVGAEDVPRDDSHLVVSAMATTFRHLGWTPPGLAVRCANAIPHGRGLGSSAAAIVAGVLAARELVPGDIGATFGPDDALAVAAVIEGHPDNVAPCLLGGATIAWTDESGGVRAARTEVHADVHPIVLIPDVAVSTTVARGLLPDQVPHTEAARTAGRAALLVEALTRRPDLLLEATADWLHQPYRRAAMPETLDMVGQLRKIGYAAVVSGAGPSVLVLATSDQVDSPLPAVGWDVRRLDVDASGAEAVIAASDGA